MKKENKYYIPTIEEFHIGFEYEEELDVSPDPPEFVKRVFSKNDSLYNMQDKIRVDSVRVKYLDVEDIVSLGFKSVEGEKSDESFGIQTFTKTEETGFNTGTKMTIKILKGNPGTLGLTLDSYGSWATSIDKFQLFIKNKPELKTLLKQIRV